MSCALIIFKQKQKKYDKNAFFSFFTWIHSPGTESFLDTIVILRENVDKVTTTELPILFTKSFHDPPSFLLLPFSPLLFHAAPEYTYEEEGYNQN